MSDHREQAAKYAAQARHMLANATRLSRERGGVEKAGEMVWGGLVLAIKAVASKRGKQLKSESAVRWAKASGLISSKEALSAVHRARALHGQFYEVDQELDELQTAKDDVEVLVDELLTGEDL